MPWDDGIDWGVDDPLYTEDPGDNIDAGGGWNPGTPEDPYANWGGGAGGDGTDGSGDSGGGINWGAALSGGSSALSGLFTSLGLVNKDGGIDLGGLLSLLGVVGGGINSINATGKASDQMKEAADRANQQATDTLAPAIANYQPYITAGHGAVDKMANFDTSPLGAKFVAAGPTSNLAGKFNSGVSLGALARKV
jgi:hypothetical protein